MEAPGPDPTALLDGYEHATVLGRGGTATVSSATRASDGVRVAVKVFDADQIGAARRQERASERLGDVAGVLPIWDTATLDDGRRVHVSPFADGGSLADRVARFGPMPSREVAELGERLATALAAAHGARVLHRDLKPSNVLLDGDDEPLLADFGAAGDLDLKTATETLAVTIVYAAPEVLEGGAADERSDVYSLGLTLLHVAAGRQPFRSDSPEGLAPLVNRICTSGVPDPRELGVDDPELASVLAAATRLDPDERYASAAELSDALGAVARGATPPIPAAVSRPAAPARARRLAPALAVGVVALAVVGGAVAWAADGGDDASTTTTTAPTATALSTIGQPVTRANGLLGPLYAQDEFAYAGKLTEDCAPDDRRVALAIHASDDDRKAGVAEPWAAVGSPEAGTFMAYLPCEAGGTNIRYVLRAPGRWFVVVASFPQDQYDRMVEWMRENETSPAPDYTVDDPIRATLTDPASYEGWEIIDRAE